ncbi:Nucleoside-diphosphate-sugar epimerase [Variovorax sp. HW608]|uniref:SDR family oxidoreductase n=1 Tax=Variovorax sp. HW608 TaxID=1034889 RepID=UPI00081F8C95|nr:SDR family oxidoreductase [Variovorax sp. HW608]SCK13766.1 Nucleoside-diphosphate-sugar epimerase [Variovorax sp. HW608]
MNVFVTGASGWVGSVVVKELLDAGHQVAGLVRSEDGATKLAAMGGRVVRGTLDDLPTLTRAAEAADAVIHTAFNHDFSKFAQNAQQDRRAIRALANGLRGTGRRLIVTSGAVLVRPGQLATEDMPQEDLSHPRRSEVEARAVEELGVRVSAVRLAPTVHGFGDQGFIPILIDTARRTGVSAYVGDGSNRWPAVHRLDAGRLYRLILEAGDTQFAYHGVAEEGIALKEIAEIIGRRLGLPVQSRGAEHFGWFAPIAAGDFPTSNARTREALQWMPSQPGLLADLDSPAYFRTLTTPAERAGI